MMIDMRSAGRTGSNVGPGKAAVHRPEDAVGAGSPSCVDYPGIRWVDDQGGVVPALTSHVIRRRSGQIRERRAAVIGAHELVQRAEGRAAGCPGAVSRYVYDLRV